MCPLVEPLASSSLGAPSEVSPITSNLVLSTYLPRTIYLYPTFCPNELTMACMALSPLLATLGSL